MPFLSASLGADGGQGALLLQYGSVKVGNPLEEHSSLRFPGTRDPRSLEPAKAVA